MMRALCLVRVAGLAAATAATAASVTGCAHAAATGAPGTASPAPSATTVAATSSPPSPTSTDTTGNAGPPVCPGSQLKITMIYGGPAAGTIGAVIGFANEGRTPCNLVGWPALVAISPAGSATARRTLVVFGATTLARPPVVTIKPEARAVAVLTGHGQPAPGMTTCPPAWRQLLVTPPGSGHASLISARIPGFTYLPACYPILVSPVVPASVVPYLRPHHV